MCQVFRMNTLYSKVTWYNCYVKEITLLNNMWCDLGKSVWSQTWYSVFYLIEVLILERDICQGPSDHQSNWWCILDKMWNGATQLNKWVQLNSFVNLLSHLERYILLKTPPELDQWFQNYEQLKDSQSNRKQKKFIPLSSYISQSMLLTSNWFR